MKSFEKIIGYESEKNELYQIIDMFKNKEVYERLGASLPKGVALIGEPGLGKTMLALATIKECNVNTYIMRKNKDTKDMINEINNTFSDATNNQPSIILLDDLDKFSESSDDNTDDTLFVTLQACIDNVKDKNILVIATINNFDKLPDSLIRAGRFDRKIFLDAPTMEDASKIIQYYFSTKSISKDINYEDIYKMITYTSCADLEKIVNESAILAGYKRKNFIDIDDIIDAYERESYEGSCNDVKCDDDELMAVSIHEAGHAVVAELIKPNSVGFVSLYSEDSEVHGFTRTCYNKFRRSENVLISLAGKAATEVLYDGRCGSGCSNDIGKAESYIYEGIRCSGTCGFGFTHNTHREVSEKYWGEIDSAIEAELNRHYIVVREMIVKNKEFVMKLAKSLKEKKRLLYSDVKTIRNTVAVNTVSY